MDLWAAEARNEYADETNSNLADRPTEFVSLESAV
jgi:hypothetical protein